MALLAHHAEGPRRATRSGAPSPTPSWRSPWPRSRGSSCVGGSPSAGSAVRRLPPGGRPRRAGPPVRDVARRRDAPSSTRSRLAARSSSTPEPGPRRRRPPPARPRAPRSGRLFGARSGDKGGNANVGIFARSDEAWAWLDGFLSVEELRRLLPETAPLAIERYRLPGAPLAQLRHPRPARRGRRRLHPPGRPGQGPRRVAAQPLRRDPHVAPGGVVSDLDDVRDGPRRRAASRSTRSWRDLDDDRWRTRDPEPRAGTSPTRSATSRSSTPPPRSAIIDPTPFAPGVKELYEGAVAVGVDEYTLGAFRAACAAPSCLAAWRSEPRGARRGRGDAARRHPRRLVRAVDGGHVVPHRAADGGLGARRPTSPTRSGSRATPPTGCATSPSSATSRGGGPTRVRGEEPPTGDVRLELLSPSGHRWIWGPENADRHRQRFGRGLLPRRHPASPPRRHLASDRRRSAGTGSLRAQAFAGGPTTGPAPRGR